MTNTHLQMIDVKELEELKKNPKLANKIDKPDDETWTTPYFCTINYVLAGDAFPEDDHPLSRLLSGKEIVSSAFMENGSFGLSSPADVKALAAALGDFDLERMQKKLEKLDFDELLDEAVDLDDLALLLEDEDGEPAELLFAEIEELIEFYSEAARSGKGLLIYTT